MVDRTDIQIFCEMGYKNLDYATRSRRPSPRRIGRRLNLHERTIRRRVRKMEKEGFIESYESLPNFEAVGLPLSCVCSFRASDLVIKHESMKNLRGQAEGVIEVVDYVGDRVVVNVAAANEHEARARFADIAGPLQATQSTPFPPRPFPACQRSPSRLDWRLIQAMRYDALRPTDMIAEDVGITSRMAEYRMGKLLASRALLVRAILNPRNPDGVIFYSVFLGLEEGHADWVKRELSAKYRDRIWSVFSLPGFEVVFNLFATSVLEADDDLLAALSLPGVKGGELAFIKGRLEPAKPNWVDRLLEEQVQSGETGREPAARLESL